MINYLLTIQGVAPVTRSVFSCLMGFRADYCPTSFLLIMSCKYLLIECALLFSHNAFMHAFVISYVRTVLRVLSKYSPGLLIWPDVDEGDLMDEEFDSESDA